MRAKRPNQTPAPRQKSPVQDKVSFSGHETFVFRYGWLKKAMDAVRRHPDVFNSDDAMVSLGVGKNMVRSIRHWALSTKIIAERPRSRGMQLETSEMGNLLFGSSGYDPYLEDINTLWVLHWNLATNEERSTVWCWAFSLLSSNEFTRESLEGLVREEVARRNLRMPSESSLRRDIDCFIHTYTATSAAKRAVLEDSLDCPLVELGMVEDVPASGMYRFARGAQPTLADEVFAHALLDFWERIAPKRETLAFSELAYGFASPGQVFRLDENSLSERLERLEEATRGRLAYTETAGLKQMYRRGKVSSLECLKQYCERSERSVPMGA